MKSVFIEAIIRVVLVTLLIVVVYIGIPWLIDILPQKTSDKILHQFGVLSCRLDSFMKRHNNVSLLPTPDEGCERYIEENKDRQIYHNSDFEILIPSSWHYDTSIDDSKRLISGETYESSEYFLEFDTYDFTVTYESTFEAVKNDLKVGKFVEAQKLLDRIFCDPLSRDRSECDYDYTITQTLDTRGGKDIEFIGKRAEDTIIHRIITENNKAYLFSMYQSKNSKNDLAVLFRKIISTLKIL